MAEARGTRVRRVAGLARKTSGKQKVGAGAAVLLLLTAPFGGLRTAQPPALEKVTAGHVVTVGPFDVRVDKLVTVGDLKPSAEPEIDGDRLFALVATVRNPGQRPEPAATLTGALSFHGAGLVSPDNGGLRPSLLSYDDGESISVINPGLTYKVAYVFEQAKGWQAQPVRMDVQRLTFMEEDPLTLDAHYWLAMDETAARGTFDVDVRR